MKNLPLVIIVSALLSACAAAQLSQISHDAQEQMVGLPKESVLACMGVPGKTHKEGKTEVWDYMSGGSSSTVAVGNLYNAGNNSTAVAGGIKTNYYCVVSVVMKEGIVTQINYSGPAGTRMHPNTQCAYAVTNCVKHE
jgi:hypothetical protein